MAEKLPIAGYWKCDEGGRAEVTQTRRAGSHFNTRCDCCGYSQATGAKRQQRIWDEADWLEGVVVKRPSNVTEKSAVEPTVETAQAVTEATEPATESATEKPAETQPDSGDFVPPDETESTEQATEKQPSKGGRLAMLGAGLTFIVTAVVAAKWNI
ncbi:MAG: hypothetical protein ACRBBW_21310 [Cellvibrionaceae bacterium]